MYPVRSGGSLESVAKQGCDTSQIQGNNNMAESLYTRLGNYDAIATFATKVVHQSQQDGLLGRFWECRGQDRLDSELQLLINYLVQNTGGQMYYAGRDMELAHKGMGITEADWTRFIEIVESVAGELGVQPTEGGEVLAFFDSLKPDIVEA
jgi:hemoglobin